MLHRKRLHVAIGVAIGTVILLAVVAAIWIAHAMRRPTYTFLLPEGSVLTEEVAIKFTKQALIKEGYGSEFMRPARYHPWSTAKEKDLYFSRNHIDPNLGHVLWKTGHFGGTWDFSVHVELAGNELRCQVYRAK